VDARTLEIELTRPDPSLPAKLAVPGISTVWSEAANDWVHAFGLGPFRVLEHTAARLKLSRIVAAGAPLPDTVEIRFMPASGRVRAVLRQNGADLVWPLPSGFESETAPPGYRSEVGPARPMRQLALVMRADLPPTSKPAARQALVHGINRDDLLVLLGPGASRGMVWAAGTRAVSFPRLDPQQIDLWKQRGKLGRSFHINLAYRGDGPAAAIARSMQGEWASHDIYVDLIPLRGPRWTAEATGGRAHALLAERQPPLEDLGADLATLVKPLYGPAAGPFRTGWRTREFDRIIAGAAGREESDLAATRLEQEMVILPIANLPWTWMERDGGPDIEPNGRLGPSGRIRGR
jgi:ABC-type transport system substrate-binding protein